MDTPPGSGTSATLLGRLRRQPAVMLDELVPDGRVGRLGRPARTVALEFQVIRNVWQPEDTPS
jgi:hypothetical protein